MVREGKRSITIDDCDATNEVDHFMSKKRAKQYAETMKKKELKEAKAKAKTIAKILTRVNEIQRMRKEIEVAEVHIARDMLDDKQDHFRKRMKSEGKAYEMPDEVISSFAGRCGACGSEAGVADVQLFHAQDNALLWMCRRCMGLNKDWIAFKQKLRELREQRPELLAAVKDANAGKRFLAEQCVRWLYDVIKVLETETIEEVDLAAGGLDEEVCDKGDLEVDKKNGDKKEEEWDAFIGSLPDYEHLKIQDSLSGTLGDLYKKRQRVRHYYMHIFQNFYLEGLIEMSVNNRNVKVRATYKDSPLLTLRAAVDKWYTQEGRCSQCNEALYWWARCYGRHNRPQIDRMDVALNTYVDNFAWLCTFCNRSKGYKVDTLRYEELMVQTLVAPKEALIRDDCDIEVVEASLTREVERQCSRQKYRFSKRQRLQERGPKGNLCC